MTALFRAQHEVSNTNSPNDGTFTVIGYREYVKTAHLRDADPNAKRFHQVLMAFKDGDAYAISYLASLLVVVFDKIIGNIDLIVCVPGHEKTSMTRTDPLASLVGQVANPRKCLDGGSILQRQVSLPRAHQDPRPRDFKRQFDSIAAQELALSRAIKRILIVDDVYSSGKTMAACYSHLKSRWPFAEVVGFAFGRTTDTPMIRWPQIPLFPTRADLSSTLLSCVAELQRESDRNKDFRPDRCFVIGRWNQKIHRPNCRYLPNQYWFLESLSEGIREGGTPCGVCRPRDVT